MGVPVKELLAAGKTAAKVTGQVAYENRDILADGARMGMSAKVKKNQDKDAKQRYRDFLMWRESGEDMEEFAFKQSELTGRPWEDIIDNIRFHSNRVQPGASATSVGKPVLSSQKALSAQKLKALPQRTISGTEGLGLKTFVSILSMQTYRSALGYN